MYYVEIKTPYNTVKLNVADIESEAFKEILEQKWVLEVKIEPKEKPFAKTLKL